MKTQTKIIIAIVLTLISFHAYTQNWPELAKKVVKQTAGIQPGDVVWINCGKAGLPLAEHIAAEIHRIGGVPMIQINTDIELKALFYDKPEANLSDYPQHAIEWQREVDYTININPVAENGKAIYKDIDPKRTALMGSNSKKFMEELSVSTHSSDIVVNLPSKETAEVSGMDYASYEKMHWEAAAVDYTKVSSSGDKIMKLLQGAKSVKITSKEGTNLTFSMGDRLVFADDGILSTEERNSKIMFARYAFLPGGWMDFAPLENSVNGTVVVPVSRCNYQPMKNITLTIKNGVVENIQAKEGLDCFNKQLEPHTGQKKTVAVFTLGLNPAMKVIQNEKTDFRPNNAAGFMTMGLGGNNSQYNGSVVASGGFGFPLVNITLEVDGTVVIKDGKLMF